ncbi:type IV toxin-antitoxin system AbiEi family antitoxin domain-containing protein [Corynebacterium breve]|uniref:type IV toxin-antitoxin system AbiEi family antitoxin domain-containing protein n=1 Tax=Corynebacterium breve TaxID=3049799 RepID=UPI003D7BF37E
MTYRTQLRQLAGNHHGIITTEQGRSHGIPPGAFRRLASAGALRRISHGVYQHLEVPVTHLTKYAAALACVGKDSWIGAQSALAMMGLERSWYPHIHVHISGKLRKEVPEFVDVAEYSGMPPRAVTEYRGLRTVSAASIFARRPDSSWKRAQMRRASEMGLLHPPS